MTIRKANQMLSIRPLPQTLSTWRGVPKRLLAATLMKVLFLYILLQHIFGYNIC